MPNKKKQSKSTKPRDSSLRITILVFGFLIFIIGLSAFFGSLRSKAHICANSITCIKDLSGKPETERNGIFLGRQVEAPTIPNTPSFEIAQARSVLGDSTTNKHIYIDLARQRLTAYEGNTVFLDVPISSGKWHPTPTGDFHIWVWLRATRMAGGTGADAYNLPNVPFTMFFGNDAVPNGWGFSLHGAYWHNNFGHPMSHGCVNMRIPDAEKIFYWSNSAINGWTTYATDANPGPVITIFGQAPANETAFRD